MSKLWYINQRVTQGGAIVPPLILDEFTGVDATIITSHTISPTNAPAATWTYVGGAVSYVKIYSNKIRSQAGSFTSVYNLAVGVSDCKLTADVAGVSTSDLCGFAFRITDINNYWYCGIVKIGADGYLRIYDITSGVETMIATGTFTWDEGVEHPLVVTLSGSLITASYLGITITYTSTVRQTVIDHGIYFVGAGTTMDNFRIDP